MDLEHRVQMLEEEVQILKNQIQATLLDIQEHLLTNKYPALRADSAAVPEISSPPAKPAAQVVTVPVQPEQAIDLPEEPEILTPPPAVIRKVTLDNLTAPANSPRQPEPEPPLPPRYAAQEPLPPQHRYAEPDPLPPQPRYADPEPMPTRPRYDEPETPKPSWQRQQEQSYYTDPEPTPPPRRMEPDRPYGSRYTEPEAPRYSRRPDPEAHHSTHIHMDSPARSSSNPAWNVTDPDGFVTPPENPRRPSSTASYHYESGSSASNTRPFIVDDDLPPTLDEGIPITEADWATLTQLQEWTLKRVNSMGPDHTCMLIKQYAQEKRISEHVKDTLLQLVTIAMVEAGDSGDYVPAPTSSPQQPADTSQEDEEGVTPNLIARLIAGIQDSKNASSWRDKNG